MKPFSLLVKPAGADCNLRCDYCFYLPRAALYPESAVHRMSDNVLQKLIAGYMATDQPRYVFGWQGGEPALMGTAFFERVTELQEKHGRSGALVANGLQTNAVLITDEMAAHFARYNFLIGVSLDGPEPMHDTYRRTAVGAGSHAAVMEGIKRLERHKVEFNILALVSRANVGRPEMVYRYFRENGYLHQQYIPCVEFDASGKLMPYSITGPEWGDFLCGLFDAWIGGDARKVSIRLFDSVINQMVIRRPTICHMEKNCCQYFLVEHNGDVYPCDFFVEDSLRIGNIAGMSWSDLKRSRRYLHFGAQKSKWNEKCGSCEYVSFCAGDCIKHRFDAFRDPRALSRLCEGWKKFYAHSLPGFRRLARGVRAGMNAGK